MVKNNPKYTNKYGGQRGWFNQPVRHSLASKGIKTKTNERRMSYIPKWSQSGFNRLSRKEQRGNIIDLAKKVAGATIHGIEKSGQFAGKKFVEAVQWEKEHLPAQASWVKDEFKEAKDLTIKAYDVMKKEGKEASEKFSESLPQNKEWLKEHMKEAKHNVEDFLKEVEAQPSRTVDDSEVKDEIDHDEDGRADITMGEFDSVNDNIKKQRESIGKRAGKLTKEVVATLTQKEHKEEQAKKLIAEVGSEREKRELEKHPRDIDVKKLSDHTLKEMAIRYEEPVINFFGGNPFESELERRMVQKQKLNAQRKKLELDLEFKRKELDKELSEKRKELKKRLEG